MRQDLTVALEDWRRDWESLNPDNYLRHYSIGKFSTATQKFDAWAEHKYRVNAGKTWLKVKVENVSMFFYPGAADLAVVTFDQNYASSNLTNQMAKRQYWINEKGVWRILYEGGA